MVASGDGAAIGLWDSDLAIPFIARLAGSDTVRFRFDDDAGITRVTDFRLNGAAQVRSGLRSACGGGESL